MNDILKVENSLEDYIRKLIDEKEYVEFLVGRNGDFDQCVSSSVHRVRKLFAMLRAKRVERGRLFGML